MKRKNLIFAVVVLLAAVFCSCEKETDPLNECANMLYFENFDEFQNEMTKVQKMTLEEKIKWQESRGFKSLGIESDKLYESINPYDFKSVEEVKEFVYRHKDYLQLTEDEGGELELVTNFYGKSEKYLLNEEGMYQIGDSVYKVTNMGIYIAHITSSDILRTKNIFTNERSPSLIFIPNISYSEKFKSTIAPCGTSNVWRSTNDNERLKVDINVDNIGNSSVVCHFIARPYKRVLGVWYWCNRRMKADIKLKFMYYDKTYEGPLGEAAYGARYDSLFFYNDFMTTSIYEETIERSGVWILSGSTLDPGFIRYEVWADTDEVAPISAKCN